MTVVAVYADGGVLLRNPSDVGGLWATCHVDQTGWRLAEWSGVIPTHEHSKPVTNNESEYFALLYGLEMLPDGWSGKVCSDSQVTLTRFRRLYVERYHTPSTVLLPANLPPSWGQRGLFTLARMGSLDFVHLKGHPTRAEVRRGVNGRGQLVSEHQVWCDLACALAGEQYMQRRALVAA